MRLSIFFYFIFFILFFLSCKTQKQDEKIPKLQAGKVIPFDHDVSVPPSPKGIVNCTLHFYKDSTEIDSAFLSKYLSPKNDSFFISYLDKNIMFPQMELDAGMSGNLFVEISYNAKFSKDTGFAIVKQISEAPEFTKEVARVFAMRPPAICDSLFTKKPPGLKHVCVQVKFEIEQ